MCLGIPGRVTSTVEVDGLRMALWTWWRPKGGLPELRSRDRDW